MAPGLRDPDPNLGRFRTLWIFSKIKISYTVWPRAMKHRALDIQDMSQKFVRQIINAKSLIQTGEMTDPARGHFSKNQSKTGLNDKNDKKTA